jgi:hypothetical protein
MSVVQGTTINNYPIKQQIQEFDFDLSSENLGS